MKLRQCNYRHFLSIKEVSNIIRISVSTNNRGVEKVTFPPKHKLSAQRVGFLKYKIDLWIGGKRSDWQNVDEIIFHF